jgi:hypothetical protein
MNSPSDLAKASEAVAASVRDRLLDNERLQIVKAPPGAGKTYLLLQLVAAGYEHKLRLAVATFTNAQADDICRRLAKDYPKVPVARFLSHRALDPDLGARVQIVRSAKDLPTGPCVVVANSSKWGFTDCNPFDVLLVDEAWQIAWADFLLLRRVAGCFVLIGDPGQIPPVVSIPTERWETSPNAPHIPTPELLRTDPALGSALEELPASRRLPSDAVDLVNEFYDFEFGAFAEPGDRYVRLNGGGSRRAADHALELLAETSMVGVTVPTPDDGPPAEVDDEVAKQVAELVRRMLDRDATTSDQASTKNKPTPLKPDEIGIVSTHRTMNTRLHYRLPKALQRVVQVDTPERWQGLERKVMIAVHPLSGVIEPTEFELETGRLCVMASRHRCALMLVTRDHIPDTLRTHIVTADQPVGRADVAGIGHHRHTRFWSKLSDDNHVVAL